jgi:hypothetical protein
MKIITLILVLLLASNIVFGQVSIVPSLGFAYTFDNRIGGVFLRNELVLRKKENFFNIGFEVQFLNGNRNFGKHDLNDYNIEHKHHAPQYLFLSGLTYQYKYPIEFEAKAARTFQLTTSLGYSRKLKMFNRKLLIEGGFYISYVNKFYQVGPFNGTEAEMMTGGGTGYDVTIDLYLPSNHRYIAIGPYIGFSYYPFNKKRKSVSFNSKFYYLGNNSSWFNIGIAIILPSSKKE